jgi:hypothetical protein
MIEVQVIAPGKPTGSGTCYHWSAIGTGLVGTSKTPLLDAARKLLVAGFDPTTPLSLVWGETDIISMTTTVGTAAALSVSETQTGPRFHRYVEFDRDALPSAA